MLAQGKLVGAAKLAVPLVIFIWIFAYMTTSSSPHATYTQVMRKFKDQHTLFVSDFLAHEVDGPFNGEPIAAMCASKQWNPDWILQCDSVPEGIGSVRNGHLQCIRLAIEIGAGGLILPEIVQRSKHDIAKTVPNAKGPIRGASIDYFFDKAHLTTTLGQLCPQIKLYSSIDDLANVPSALNGIKLEIPKAFVSAGKIGLLHGSVVDNAKELGEAVRAHVRSKDDGKLRPLKSQLPWSAFWYPVASDPPEFVASFGRLLRVRADARRLAAETLFALRSLHGLDLDPKRPRPAGSEPGALSKSFVGVRLRTDRDVQAKNPPWPSYVDQAPHFAGLLSERQAPLVYLSQGAAADNETAFKERGAQIGAAVVTKWDLLDGADLQPQLQELQALTWDQQALVDYEVMLWAGLVTGIAHSSFTWNLAARRKVAYGGADMDEGSTGVGKLQEPQGDIQYQDPYTVIFRAGSGKKAPQKAEAMQLSIWP